jgi:hypothetical protein
LKLLYAQFSTVASAIINTDGDVLQYDDSDDDDDEPSRRRRRLAAERAADGRLDVDDEDAGMLSLKILFVAFHCILFSSAK